MTVKRMDHVGVVVDDMAAAKAFFGALGLEEAGAGTVEGAWVGRIIGLDGVRSDIAMMRTPDGHAQVELVRFHTPPAVPGDADGPSNARGIRHLCFLVDDLDDVLSRLCPLGAELVGTVEQYRDVFRLCYLRGPGGIILELAEEVK